MTDYRAISADSHAIEPPDLWTTRLPAALRARGPRVVSEPKGDVGDVDGIRLRESIGVERIMWSSDFPHLDSSWPESRRFLDKHLGEVPPDEARLIVAGNCARLYHLA